ncbi:MAG: ATP-binding protein [Deltaproteobacteria bacterium]|nr:ATP-binding protein [Deltaproteobacteria bacterium]
MYSRDYYLNRIRPFFGKPVVKVITGMRRVGKSCLLRIIKEALIASGLQEENILLIDKESLEFDFLATATDLYRHSIAYFGDLAGPKALLVDEIQEIEHWERAVASILGRGDIDIVITGSNASMFSVELATKLSGRFVEFPVYSLSFSEFMAFRDSQCGPMDEEFRRYLRYGGLPGIHHMYLNDEIIFQYLKGIYSTILLKDIVSRHSIRQVNLLERIAFFLFDNIGQIFSANSIASFLKSQHLRIGVDTVANYLRYFQDALIAHKAPRYDIKGRRYLELYEKYYLGDTGLRHAVLGFRETDIAQILENVVYLELLRRQYEVSIGKIGDREIDFIATRENQKLYIQVTYLLASPETMDREFSPLLAVDDNYPKMVLSMDTMLGNDFQGIKRMYLPDFLTSFPS